MSSSAAIHEPFEAMSDDPLMLAYAGGNAHAFDALYGRHETALYRFIRRLLGLRLAAEVDEVFNETWSRIISARDGFSPRQASWRVWAFTIAHRMANDRLQTSGREVAFYAHDEDGDGLDAAQLFSRGLLRDGAANDAAQPSQEELAFWQAAGRRLLACLDELSDHQRAAFLLHQEEGFTPEAIAATLDLGAETVRGHQRRALKKLRECMERYLSVGRARMSPADDLHDDHLRQALAHAPDQNAVPDWRLRKAILRKAHDAIGATDPDTDAAELERAARPWWRPERARGGRRARRWGVAFASVLAALVVVVLWRREPASGPKLDAEIVKVAPAPSTPPAPASPPAPELAATAVEPLPSPPAPPEQVAVSPPSSPPPPAQRPPPPPRPLPVAPPIAMVPPSVDGAPGIPPSPPARKPPPTTRTDETEPPTFAALATWSRITISRRGGESRTLSRAEARELNALLGSAALSAAGPRPLAGAPEWRVTLERGKESLAVFEIAGAQVRWREGGTPSATGVPSAPALAALRQALEEAVQPPPAAAAEAEPPRNP